jgi:hypothetical protein
MLLLHALKKMNYRALLRCTNEEEFFAPVFWRRMPVGGLLNEQQPVEEPGHITAG